MGAVDMSKYEPDHRGTIRRTACFVALACALVVSTSRASSFYPGSFSTISLSGLPAPVDLITADFNGDHLPDLAVSASGTPNTVGILLGAAGGGFGALRTYSLDIYPGWLAAADVTSDGVLDLITTEYGSAGVIAVLPGAGDGSFGPAQRSSAGKYPLKVVAGDVDGDGQPDAVVVNDKTDYVSVLRGLGDGTFEAPHSVSMGLGVSAVRIGDLDGDDALDLVALNAERGRSLSVRLNDGAGGFEGRRVYRCEEGDGFILADLNGDGRLDAIVTDASTYYDGSTRVLLGNGTGGFLAPDLFNTGVPQRSPVVADVTRDGRMDVVVVDGPWQSDRITVLPGNGHGQLGTPSSYPTGAGAFACVLTEATGDGQLDVATVNSLQTLSILPGRDNGTFGRVPLPAGGVPAASPPATGDVNEDGRIDVAVATGDNLTVLLGDGAGGLGTPILFSTGDVMSVVALADVTGDGHLDLLGAAIHALALCVLAGDGSGGFSTSVAYPLSGGPQSIDTGDLNGDGLIDVVVGTDIYASSSPVAVLLAKPDGSLEPAVDYFAPEGVLDVAIGDVDGDGDLDLGAAVGYTSRVSIFLNSGGGTFSAPINTAYLGGEARSAAFEDVTNDGLLDLLVLCNRSPVDCCVTVLIGNGNGTFSNWSASRDFFVSRSPRGLAVGDVTGDGIVDLFTTSYLNIMSFLEGQGGGIYAPEVAYGTGQDPGGIAIADMNGDGRLDAIVSDTGGYGGLIGLDVMLHALDVPTAIRPRSQSSSFITCSPNPVKTGATLQFALERAAQVRISIVDVGGRIMAWPVDNRFSAGEHAIPWIPRGAHGRLPAGVYAVVADIDGTLRRTTHIVVLR